jgi:hypothetical protein
MMEETMNQRQTMLAFLAAGLIAACGASALYAQDNRADPALAEAMEDTTITLQQGLTAAAVKGRPISAKFEMEDRKLQLSVYTAKGKKFSENIIDPMTHKIAKTQPITEGDDLSDAKAQSAAMAKTKSSLKSAADSAMHAASGFQALSVIPQLKNGRAVASVALLRGNELRTVDQPLR